MHFVILRWIHENNSTSILFNVFLPSSVLSFWSAITPHAQNKHTNWLVVRTSLTAERLTMTCTICWTAFRLFPFPSAPLHGRMNIHPRSGCVWPHDRKGSTPQHACSHACPTTAVYCFCFIVHILFGLFFSFRYISISLRLFAHNVIWAEYTYRPAIMMLFLCQWLPIYSCHWPLCFWLCLLWCGQILPEPGSDTCLNAGCWLLTTLYLEDVTLCDVGFCCQLWTQSLSDLHLFSLFSRMLLADELLRPEAKRLIS